MASNTTRLHPKTKQFSLDLSCSQLVFWKPSYTKSTWTNLYHQNEYVIQIQIQKYTMKKQMFVINWLREVANKRIFYVGIRRGESAPSALTVSKCENWFFDTQNTFYLILKGLKNTFFMPFTWLSKWGAGLFQMIIRRAAAVRGGIGDSKICMKIEFFLGKIRFKTHIIMICGKKYTKSWS